MQHIICQSWQILISQQNSECSGLTFSPESKLIDEGPSCLCTTSATLVQNRTYDTLLGQRGWRTSYDTCKRASSRQGTCARTKQKAIWRVSGGSIPIFQVGDKTSHQERTGGAKKLPESRAGHCKGGWTGGEGDEAESEDAPGLRKSQNRLQCFQVIRQDYLALAPNDLHLCAWLICD